MTDRHTGAGTSRPWTRNLTGPSGQLFADPSPGPDETSFQVDNTSDQYYRSPYYAQHADQVLAVPLGPPAAPLALQSVVGAPFLQPITAARRISFHAVSGWGVPNGTALLAALSGGS